MKALFLAVLLVGCATSNSVMDLEQYRIVQLSVNQTASGIHIIIASFDNLETPEPIDFIVFWRQEDGKLLGISYLKDGKFLIWDSETRQEREVEFEESRKLSSLPSGVFKQKRQNIPSHFTKKILW